MADFEDANAPVWANMIEGQRNLYDAVRRTITYTGPEGRSYRLNENPAVLFVRPRGWHLVEKQVRIDGRPVSRSPFDFALYFYHKADLFQRLITTEDLVEFLTLPGYDLLG